MVKEQFKVSINAPREKVWNSLWQEDTYREWTKPFSPDSHYEGDWSKGSEIRFTDGKGSGMIAEIADNLPNEYMAIKHLGEIKDGIVDKTTYADKGWGDTMETYRLTGNNPTEVTVELDIVEEYSAMFRDMFPKALNKLKEIAER